MHSPSAVFLTSLWHALNCCSLVFISRRNSLHSLKVANAAEEKAFRSLDPQLRSMLFLNDALTTRSALEVQTAAAAATNLRTSRDLRGSAG